MEETAGGDHRQQAQEGRTVSGRERGGGIPAQPICLPPRRRRDACRSRRSAAPEYLGGPAAGEQQGRVSRRSGRTLACAAPPPGSPASNKAKGEQSKLPATWPWGARRQCSARRTHPLDQRRRQVKGGKIIGLALQEVGQRVHRQIAHRVDGRKSRQGRHCKAEGGGGGSGGRWRWRQGPQPASALAPIEACIVDRLDRGQAQAAGEYSPGVLFSTTSRPAFLGAVALAAVEGRAMHRGRKPLAAARTARRGACRRTELHTAAIAART